MRRAPPEFSNIFAPGAPLPNTQLGEAGDTKLPQKKNKPRKPTGRQGKLKLSQPALESAIFWRAPPTNPPNQQTRKTQYFPCTKSPSPGPNWDVGKCETTEDGEKRGTTRNATKCVGALKFTQPALGSPYFGAFLPNSPKFLAPDTPPKPNWGWLGMQNYPGKRQAAPQGAVRSAARRLNLANSNWNPLYFGRLLCKFRNIVFAGHPIPQRPIGEGGAYETTDDKGQTAEPRGTLRGAKLTRAALESAIFGGVRLNFPIFLAPVAPSPTHNWRRGGVRNYRRQKKASRGTPRNATESDGAIKFRLTGTESAEFWRVPPKQLPKLYAPDTHDPRPNWGRWITRKYRWRKRLIADPRGTLRSLTEGLNIGDAPWFRHILAGSSKIAQ